MDEAAGDAWGVRKLSDSALPLKGSHCTWCTLLPCTTTAETGDNMPSCEMPWPIPGSTSPTSQVVRNSGAAMLELISAPLAVKLHGAHSSERTAVQAKHESVHVGASASGAGDFVKSVLVRRGALCKRKRAALWASNGAHTPTYLPSHPFLSKPITLHLHRVFHTSARSFHREGSRQRGLSPQTSRRANYRDAWPACSTPLVSKDSGINSTQLRTKQ